MAQYFHDTNKKGLCSFLQLTPEIRPPTVPASEIGHEVNQEQLSISMDLQLNDQLSKNNSLIGSSTGTRIATLNTPGVVLPILLDFQNSESMNGASSLSLAPGRDVMGDRHILQGKTALVKRNQSKNHGPAKFDIFLTE